MSNELLNPGLALADSLKMADRRLIKRCVASPSMWPAAAFYVLKKAAGRREIKIRRQGLTLAIGASSGQGAWQAISGLDYEPELKQILTKIQPGDVIFDIGANIGSYSLRMARKTGPTGQVISIEAMEANVRLLKQNIALGQMTNVTVLPCAVGAHDSRVPLYSSGHSSSVRLGKRDDFRHVGEVEMTTGDRLAEKLQLSRLDWIKIDIEGGEPDALRGLSKTIAKFRPNILFENAEAGRETTRVLRDAGYRVGRFGERHFVEIDPDSPEENLFAVPVEKLVGTMGGNSFREQRRLRMVRPRR